MCNKRVLSVLLVLALTASFVSAQTAQKEAENVLNYVPSDAMGFVVIPNLKTSTSNLQTFLNGVGVGPMIQAQMPGGLIGGVKKGLGLGEGFNPNGGMALIMLQPKKYGVDLAKVMPDASGKAREELKFEELPMIIVMAGDDVKSTVDRPEATASGDLLTWTDEQGKTWFGGQKGDYVLLSPLKKALNDTLKAKKAFPTVCTKDQESLIGKADIYAHVEMEQVAPIYVKMMENAAKQMKDARKGDAEMDVLSSLMPIYTRFYSRMLGDMDYIDLAINFDNTNKGLVIDEIVAYKPDSKWGKMIASVKGGQGDLVGKLPSGPYVAAFGSSNQGKGAEIWADLLQDMFKTDVFEDVKQSDRTKAVSLSTEFFKQMTGFQFAIGGTGEADGVVGLACVLECKDADKLQELLADGMKVKDSFINQLFDDPDIKDLKISYAKDVAKVGGKNVDAIKVEHPETAEMSQSERQEMKKFLAEDEVNIYVAKVDAKTVVMTFGGSTEYLATALKAAGNGGKILKDDGVKQGLAVMPKNPETVGFVSIKNLFQTVKAGADKVGAGNRIPPLAFQNAVPITFAARYQGPACHLRCYVPTATIRETMTAAQMIMMHMMQMNRPGQGGREPLGGEDF
ncbi:MAG: hypothetical protein ACLFVU_02300 [Phycisphaerae bacterium]